LKINLDFIAVAAMKIFDLFLYNKFMHSLIYKCFDYLTTSQWYQNGLNGVGFVMGAHLSSQ